MVLKQQFLELIFFNNLKKTGKTPFLFSHL